MSPKFLMKLFETQWQKNPIHSRVIILYNRQFDEPCGLRSPTHQYMQPTKHPHKKKRKIFLINFSTWSHSTSVTKSYTNLNKTLKVDCDLRTFQNIEQSKTQDKALPKQLDDSQLKAVSQMKLTNVFTSFGSIWSADCLGYSV